jgi:DNA-binding response OmpR family regulator
MTIKGVLVVEDVALERKLLSESLKRAGFAVVAAGRGKDGIRQVADRPGHFGLLLLDMRLPDVSGLDVYRAVRHLDPTVKIVLCPGLVDSEDTRAALAEGADGCLPKPLDFQQVIALARSHLANTPNG